MAEVFKQDESQLWKCPNEKIILDSCKYWENMLQVIDKIRRRDICRM